MTINLRAQFFALVFLSLQLTRSLGSVSWTDWTSATQSSSPGYSFDGSATGVITNSGTNVYLNYSGDVAAFVTSNDSTLWANSNIYNPAIAASDVIYTVGGVGPADQIIFSQPVSNLVMHWYSIGDPRDVINITFTQNGATVPAGFNILSIGSEFTTTPIFERRGDGKNLLHGEEGSGTIQFTGIFTNLQWKTDGIENWFAFQVGLRAPSSGVAVFAAIAQAAEIYWLAVTGSVYQVQTTTSLETPNWSDFGDPVIGDNTTKSAFDKTRDRTRLFYRVIRLE